VRYALLGFGLLNAILYTGLLPLWEGFDEPFHYGYVQHLWATHSLPVQRQTVLSEEVWQSFPLAPASYLVKRNLPMVPTFEDSERANLRRRLAALDPALGAMRSQAPNYESLHAPLAYALLVPFNAIWSQSPLPDRVWRLRVIAASASVLVTGLLVLALARLLQLDTRSQYLAVFLTFSTQMFYGSTAHIANDWLAVPLFLLVIVCGVRLYNDPDQRTALALGLSLAAGLLTKSYFLSLVPFALGLAWLRCQWRDRLWLLATLLLASPWYIRNEVLYRNLSGQQETFGGASTGALAQAALHLPWLHSFVATARDSIWYGNNSATAFSVVVTSIMFTLLGTCALYYFGRRITGAEKVVIAALLLHVAGLAYADVVQYFATHSDVITPPIWIAFAFWPPAYCLLVSRAPRILHSMLCCVWAYVICVTYVAKLIPMYAAHTGPSTLSALWRWYSGSFDQLRDNLSTVALIPPTAIFILTAAVVLSAIALAVRIVLLRPQVAVIAKPLDRARPQQP
jgi:hypothetical protein